MRSSHHVLLQERLQQSCDQHRVMLAFTMESLLKIYSKADKKKRQFPGALALVNKKQQPIAQ